MADFAGRDFTNAARLVDPAGRTAEISLGVRPTLSISRTSPSIALSRGTPQPALSAETRAIAGRVQELFGGRLFERIVIVPGSKALGFVLSATQFPVEVWNTFRNANKILETIAISGAGGIAIDDRFGEPLVYGALDSFTYQATMPSAGPAQINQAITFSFDGGVAVAIAISGSRVTVFSAPPEWGEGITETISFLTDVFTAYSDNEQRRGLRQLARRGLKFRTLAIKARDAAGVEALVWGWQHQPYGVPWWQDQTPLLDDTPAGSFFIPCDTTDRQFAAGGLVIVWVDEFTYEALSIDSVASGGVTVSSPTQFSWSAGRGTLVMPVFLARLKIPSTIDRLTSAMDQIELEFVGEASQPAPAPAVTLTSYRGFNVLEVSPNWIGGLNRQYARSTVILDPKIGPISAVDKGGTPIVSHEFPWYLPDHATVTKLRAILLAQFGRLNGFWIPTWDQDLVLAQDALSTDTGIAIASEFYTRFFFPSKARQYLAFIPTDGTAPIYRKVTAAADRGDGTELLTLDSELGRGLSKDQTQISFLTFVRFASDDFDIEWLNSDLAASTLSIQELPREVP